MELIPIFRETKYTYNTENFRLTRILTTRNSGADILQDLNYWFDPAGNIMEMQDDAHSMTPPKSKLAPLAGLVELIPIYRGQTHYFQNAVVSPNGKYEYDALYRLTKATGREHYGQGQIGNGDFPINAPVPGNPSAVENYTETYEYDELGNIEKLIHQANSGNWTRGYHYDTSTSNLLLKTSLPGDTIGTPATYSSSYTHDAHGNMTSMPHLSNMIWDYKDRLREVDLGGGGTAWYVYDAQGTRVRKVIENGSLKKDRLYLDEINEYYREYLTGNKDYERETLHVMDERKRLAVVETKTWENGSAVGTPSPVIRYQFDNHLGSASLELDTSANIISYEEYHPFGTSAYRLGSSVSEVSLKRYRYVGKERDDESGLYYYGARYYAAWLCRFVSVDPLKDDYPSLASYVYATNNSINAFDPDGRLVIYVNGFMLDQYLKKDNRKTIDIDPDPKFQVYIQNPNYRPYPTNEMSEVNADGPQYLGEKFDYWEGIDNSFADRWGDQKRIYVSGSNMQASSAEDRMEAGKKSGRELIERIVSGEVTLEEGETIKIVGHSHGAAHAAGMAEVLNQAYKDGKIKNKVEQIAYLAPHQPGDITTPKDVFSVQYSRQSDKVSSKSLVSTKLISGGSELASIGNVTEFVTMPEMEDDAFLGIGGDDGVFGTRGGHDVGTYSSIFNIDQSNFGGVSKNPNYLGEKFDSILSRPKHYILNQDGSQTLDLFHQNEKVKSTVITN